MNMIMNLTQHAASAEQKLAGVLDLSGEKLDALRQALTFDTLPTGQDVQSRAECIAALAAEAVFGGDDPYPSRAMIGGAPYLMSALESALWRYGITPVYAFSVRESAETVQADGTTLKTAVFRHAGFVGAA